MLTLATLKEIFPKCKNPAAWVEPLNYAMRENDINTMPRIAAFLAQVGHESGSLNTVSENLNYSAERLVKVWPSRFKTIESATPYSRNPEKLANKVYADRMGNSTEASGDGYRYRGRGLLQLTGKSNYIRVGEAIGYDLIKNPDLLLTEDVAALSAAYYWKSSGCNALADDETGDDDIEDFTAITKKINGGTIGLADRLKEFHHILKVLA